MQDDVGIDNVPGFWSDFQLAGWRDITDAVHANGFTFRHPPTRLKRCAAELTTEESRSYVPAYAKAAENTASRFMGRMDTFLTSSSKTLLVSPSHSNQRTDEYGGSIENRSRLFLEVLDAVAEAVGPTKVGARLLPFSLFQGMRMADPLPTFTYLISSIRERDPDFAYLHMVEPRIDGSQDRSIEPSPVDSLDSLDFARDIWQPKPFIAAGGYTAESARARAEETGDIIATGRYFISKPDLPLRLRYSIPLKPYDRAIFYTPDEVGYTDHTFAEELGGKSISVTA